MRHLRQHAQLGVFQRRHLDLQVGDLLGEGLVLDQRLAVLLLGAGDVLQRLDAALGLRHGGDAEPLVGQQELGAGPALVLLADQVRDRHLDVVEEHLVHLVAAVSDDDRLHGDARRLHVDQQEGDALLRLGLGIGAHQAEDPVGPVAHRVPGLRAVDDVVVALPAPPWCAGARDRSPSPARNSPGTTTPCSRGSPAGTSPSARRCRRCRSPARPSWCRTG